jgi:Ni/Co efflux regulator RcnB
MKNKLIAVVAAAIVAALLVAPADARPKTARRAEAKRRSDTNTIAGWPHHGADAHLLVRNAPVRWAGGVPYGPYCH